MKEILTDVAVAAGVIWVVVWGVVSFLRVEIKALIGRGSIVQLETAVTTRDWPPAAWVGVYDSRRHHQPRDRACPEGSGYTDRNRGHLRHCFFLNREMHSVGK